MKRIAILLFVPVVLAGCMAGGKYSSQSTTIDTTAALPHATNYDTLPLVKWVDLYKDPALSALIRMALDSNRNMLTAIARMEESRERAGVVKSNLWPSIGYNATAGAAHVEPNAQAVGAAIDGNTFELTGRFSWEIDLFGKLRHLNRAAQAEYLADAENANAVQVDLVGQVAELYFILRDLDNRLDIARRTLVSRTENTRLITERFNKGYVPELDKLQAEQQQYVVEASIPDLERLVVETENALNVLVGRKPGTIARGLANAEQNLEPEIPVGLPSQLLERRPDIREADRLVEAEFNVVGATKANMFPTLSLNGILGFASPELSSLLKDNSFLAAGSGSLFGPLFEFNRRRNLKRAEEYRLKQTVYQYEQTVLRAFAEVDNALYGYRSYTTQYDVVSKQVASATKALELTNARYEYGYTSYLEVIIQEDNLFEAELQQSFLLQKKLNSVVNLYRSLGGGW